MSHNWTSGATEATALTRRGSRVTGRVRGDRLRVIHMQEPAFLRMPLLAARRPQLAIPDGLSAGRVSTVRRLSPDPPPAIPTRSLVRGLWHRHSTPPLGIARDGTPPRAFELSRL